jgi:hypothetical protein
MRDNEGGVDLAFLHALNQHSEIVLHRGLGHPESEATVDGGPRGDVVEKAAADPDDQDGVEVAAAMDHLAENMRTIRAHEGCDLHASRTESKLASDAGSVPTESMQASAPRPWVRVLDAVVDILFPEVESLRASAKASRSGTVSIAITRFAPSRNALRMAN